MAKDRIENRFRVVDTYERMERLVLSWFELDMPRSMCIVGRPGTGKSHAYENLFEGQKDGEDYLLFKSRSSAIELYHECRKMPSADIVFDDIRKLLKDSDSIDLLKSLCDTRDRNVIRWRTRAVPEDEREYTSTAKTLMIVNWVPVNDADVDAITDRMDVFQFDPTKKEIIARMRVFAKCQKDVDTLRDAPALPSLRTLKKFEYWKASKYIKEMEELMSDCHVSPQVMQVKAILESGAKGKDRFERYAEVTGAKYATARKAFSRHQGEAQQLIDAANSSGMPTKCACDDCKKPHRPKVRKNSKIKKTKVKKRKAGSQLSHAGA